MDPIDGVLAAADRALRRYGIDAADRASLLADLRLDLQAAAEDGIGPDRLLGPDVAGFARRLADEAGLARHHSERERLLRAALIGAAIGAAVGYALLKGAYPRFVQMMDLPRSLDVPVQVTVTVYYGVPAAIVVAAAVIAVRVALRGVPRIRETARAMAVLLPLAGMLVTPVTMAFAWSTGYSVALPVVLAEIAMVLAALGGATLLARRWALRSRRRPADVPPADVALN